MKTKRLGSKGLAILLITYLIPALVGTDGDGTMLDGCYEIEVIDDVEVKYEVLYITAFNTGFEWPCYECGYIQYPSDPFDLLQKEFSRANKSADGTKDTSGMSVNWAAGYDPNAPTGSNYYQINFDPSIMPYFEIDIYNDVGPLVDTMQKYNKKCGLYADGHDEQAPYPTIFQLYVHYICVIGTENSLFGYGHNFGDGNENEHGLALSAVAMLEFKRQNKNTDEWKKYVIAHEAGHTWPLGIHQADNTECMMYDYPMNITTAPKTFCGETGSLGSGCIRMLGTQRP